jgi:predicted ribosome quality control (RQC) complex YloA/Tae2 family protein
MARIELDIKKSVPENAEVYFDKAKKAKKKIKGAETTLNKYKDKLEILRLKKQVRKEEEEERRAEEASKEKRKPEWYEKFRWFISSEGFLVIGGRDATTNEIVVKKHTDKDDVVFHTDMAGSPFFIIKTEGKKPGDATLQETANATFTFSKAFKLGLMDANVFWVTPDQVTKEAQAGEYLPKGAFMIRGKTNYIHPKPDIAVGMTSAKAIMGGPVAAVKKHCKDYVELRQGKEKSSAIAKKIRAKIGGAIDDIIRVMPSGGIEIKK